MSSIRAEDRGVHRPAGKMDRKKIADSVATTLLVLAGITTCGLLLLILAYTFVEGLPAIGWDFWKFIFTSPHGVRAEGGIFPTVVASLYVTLLAALMVTPVGVGAAIYLAEYATEGRLVRLIRFGGDSLASVPSIVFGLFGLAFFVYILGMGWSMLSGALTLSVMILPVVVRTAEEGIIAVPNAYRRGSYGLGATKWQTIRRIVLPAAMPRILTGIILGVSRAFGEAAAVMLTAGMAIGVPILPTDSGRAMPVHLYFLASEGTNMKGAYGTAVLLVLVILVFNIVARRMVKRV